MHNPLIHFQIGRKPPSEFIKYVIGGATAYSIDFLLLVVLTELFGITVLISAAVSFLVGLIIIYLLSISWIFENRIRTNSYHEFLIFSFIGIIGLLLNETLIWVSLEFDYVHYTVAKILSAGLVFVWNFAARKLLLFRAKNGI